MSQPVAYHMRDQVRHRVRDIMRTRPDDASSPGFWPAAALVVGALTVVNVLLAAVP